MFPILNLGPLAIQVPGLFLLAGLWLAVTLVEREAPRHKLPPDTVNNMVYLGLIVGILGARLWYALRFLDVYVENPTSLFSLNPSTLAPLEGALTGLVAAWIYGQRKGLSLWPALDSLTPGLAAFAIAVGFSHLASGDAFGAPASLPWAIQLWGERRHPTQIYEILLAGMITFTILRVERQKLPAGFLFLSWVVLAASSRLLLEAFRGDSLIVFGSLRSPQLISLALLLAALAGMHLLARGRREGQAKV